MEIGEIHNMKWEDYRLSNRQPE